jgi:hypothetical protein
MIPSTLRILILVLLVCTGTALRAQNSAAAPKSAPVFTALAWDVFDSSEELVLNYTHKKKLRTVQILWRDRSQPMPFDGPGTLVFSRTVEKDGKKIEEPVATAEIPEGMTRALLVFGPNPRPAPGESAIRVMVIDDSYPVFPGQSVRFVNYSRLSLGGSLGATAFEVLPGRDQVVPATLPEPNRLLPFRLARREAGGWRKLRSTGLPMTEGLRVMVFLIDDAVHPGRAEMVLLRDTVAAEPKAP